VEKSLIQLNRGGKRRRGSKGEEKRAMAWRTRAKDGEKKRGPADWLGEGGLPKTIQGMPKGRKKRVEKV